MKTFMDLELWVYSPQGKSYVSRYRRGGRTTTYNVHVILGSRRWFKNVRSKKVAIFTVAERTVDLQYIEASKTAEMLINNPDQFLLKLIGTKDKRTKQYKKFVEQVDDFKVWLMTKILKEEN